MLKVYFLVFDVTNSQSFEILRYLLQSINWKVITIILKKLVLETKSIYLRKLKKEANKFDVTNSTHYFEASALENKRILEAMNFCRGTF
jgi:hypothetical protein